MYYLGSEESSPKSNGSTPSTSTQKQEEEEKAVKEEEEVKVESSKPTIVLHSHKMKELKDLLLAEKLNTHAISLHLTAQSQVQVGKKGRGESDSSNLRPKRARRE